MKIIKKIVYLIKKAIIFYLKNIKKKEYFTITENGEITMYVFNK